MIHNYINDFELLKNPLQYGSGYAYVNGIKIYSYGLDNLLPYDLMRLYELCNIHNSIIETKVNMYSNLHLIGIENVFEDSSIFEKIFFETEMYGGFALKVKLNELKRIESITPISVADLRFIYDDSTKLEINEVLWNPNFYTPQIYSSKRYPVYINGLSNGLSNGLYNVGSGEIVVSEEGEFVVYFTDKRYTLQIYPVPSYVGGIMDMITYTNVRNYMLRYTSSGFVPAKMIIVPNIMSDQVIDELEAAMRMKYTGTNNAGNFIIVRGDTLGSNIEIKDININNVNDFNEILEISKKNIILSHQIPEILIGIATPGTLGQRKELEEFRKVYIKDYIYPIGIWVIEHINKILKYFKYPEIGVEFDLNLSESDNVSDKQIMTEQNETESK